ncbi:MAG: HAD-IIIA family hydrolase [Lachnospiraceae bacterium]|nr:HAD-IIIA family hydrolase [Lachnospiraceae bacterium]
MKAVIMAGGKGTRIASVASDIPKPMIPICDKPILQHQIECLRAQNITDITLIVGHLGHVIEEYFEDGSKFGVNISYIVEEQPLGTAGALYFLKETITEDFILLNGDIIFDVDFERFMNYHKEKGGYATILTHPNSHPYDSGLVVTNADGLVTKWMHKEDERMYYKNRVNAGLHILSPKVLEMFTEAKKTDLDRDILKQLIPQQKLVAYDSPEYVKDMGTPDRYQKVTEDVMSGLVHAKNLKNKQKAVFLDRDGTINVYKGFITKAEDMELIPGITEVIKKINDSGYLAIVVTNQPVIARGDCTFEELQEINEKMETLLGAEGAYIDDLFYCPHHPDKGFEGERVEFKIDCECRKPKPGMLLAAAEKYNIDLSVSYMVGDDVRDMEAGRRAGCKCVKVERLKEK